MLDAYAAVHQLLVRLGLVAFWTHRSATQKRAIITSFAFFLLVFLRVTTSDSASVTTGASMLNSRFNDPDWHQLVADVPRYTIYAVADNDDSNVAAGATNTRESAFVEGVLNIKDVGGKMTFSVEWHPSQKLMGKTVRDGRGMELSTLQFWKGALFTCDDRTGIVYEIDLSEGLTPKLYPRHILADGDGKSEDGFRCEWSTLKGDFLFIGSTGKPWVDAAGQFVHANALWIKSISPPGVIKSIDWRGPFQAMQRALGVPNGYLVHECALWSSSLGRWIFIPRHVSNTPYKPGDEVKHGSTVVLIADANFKTILTNNLQGVSKLPSAGVTECKFIPNGREREIFITKVIEVAGSKPRSFASVINTDGEVLMEDTPMPEGWKFEGVELRPIIHANK